jgi:hypothetical protein
MVSIGPFNRSSDMRHMYNFTDLCSSKSSIRQYPEGSIMDTIASHPDFTVFSSVIVRANKEEMFSDSSSIFTLMIPSDSVMAEYNFLPDLTDLDIGTARAMVRGATLRRKIDRRLIQSSPTMTLPTIDRGKTLSIVTNVDGSTVINGKAYVVHWNHPCSNGIVHVTDRFF